MAEITDITGSLECDLPWVTLRILLAGIATKANPPLDPKFWDKSWDDALDAASLQQATFDSKGTGTPLSTLQKGAWLASVEECLQVIGKRYNTDFTRYEGNSLDAAACDMALDIQQTAPQVRAQALMRFSTDKANTDSASFWTDEMKARLAALSQFGVRN